MTEDQLKEQESLKKLEKTNKKKAKLQALNTKHGLSLEMNENEVCVYQPDDKTNFISDLDNPMLIISSTNNYLD
jgi:hypothetical protein